MKECVIIHYFVNDYYDDFILNKSLDSISKLCLDIILVSHSRISKETQKKVKYFLYSGDDELVNFDDVYNEKTKIFTEKRFIFDSIEISPFLYVVDDFSYSFSKMVYDAYRLAVAFGYDYSYYMIGDFEINQNEIEEIKKIPELLKKEGKLGYFDESNVNSEGFFKEYLPNCFFWYVENKWYLENFFLNMNSKEEFFIDLKKFNLYCHYDWLFGYMVEKNRENSYIKKVERYGHNFVTEERSDLSKKKNNKLFGRDVGIFYDEGIPQLFCFDQNDEKIHWNIYLEYDDNSVVKYSIKVPDKMLWTMYQIEIRENIGFHIKCENNKTNEVKYNVYINDLEKYKKIFRFKK